MASSSQVRSLFQAYDSPAQDVPSSACRKLIKAYAADPALHAAVRSCKTREEKFEVLRKAGLSPITSDELKAEIAKCLLPAPGTVLSLEDRQFAGDVLHLITASITTSHN